MLRSRNMAPMEKSLRQMRKKKPARATQKSQFKAKRDGGGGVFVVVGKYGSAAFAAGAAAVSDSGVTESKSAMSA